METEVLVVGAGMIGASIARELSQYNVDVTVVEKSPDMFTGQTKSGHGLVYSGNSLVMAISLVLKSIMAPDTPLWEPDTKKIKLAVEGYELFEPLAKKLEMPHQQTKLLVIARNDEELKTLERLVELCDLMGIRQDLKRLTRSDVMDLEPNVTNDVIAGLYEEKWCKTIFAPDYAIANAENARENGVKFIYDAEVKSIGSLNGGFAVVTTKGSFNSRFIINAGGLYADRIADMADARDDWSLIHERSQMLVLDKRLKENIFRSINCLHATPKPGVFEAIQVQIHGNPYVFCGSYYPAEDKEALETRKEWFKISMEMGRRLTPLLSDKDIITSFAGIRAFNTRDPEDHIIQFSKRRPGFLNVVVRLPGFAASAAVARYVVDLLGNEGLQLVEKRDYKSFRKAIPRFSELTEDKRNELIKEDCRYGHVVCRCETVTEGEIVEAIKRGAKSVQGVQFRTRAGMGRCQRGFCGPRVVGILARELGIHETEVTFKGQGSEILKYRSKELLHE